MFTEVVISASNTDSTIYVWDLRSGATIFTFKQSLSLKGGLTLVPRPNATFQIGSILTAQTDRATLNVYDWRRDQITHKMLTPEKIVTVAASHQGQYIAGATAKGRIYIWHISSGLLVKVFDAHYRNILRLGFSNDDTLLISVGEDATINVWLVSSLLSDDNHVNNNSDINDISLSGKPSPLYSWSDHTLPVTDIYIGSGTLSTTRVYTSSLDFTVKVWDLATGELLTTFLFPKAVSTLIVNPSETMLFAACGNEIYLVELFKRRQQQTYQSIQTLGGLGKVEGVGTDSSSSSNLIFNGHTNTIHSLSLSFDGSLLISGSEDGNCIVWDVNSRQSLRQFTSHKGPVTHVSCILKPNELSTGTITTAQQKYTPMAWKSFKRSIITNEEKSGIDQQLMNTLSDLDQHQQLIERGPFYSDLQSEFSVLNQVRDQVKLFNQLDSSNDLQTQVASLQNELSELYEHHEKVKSLHTEAYHTLVDQFILDRKKAKQSLLEDQE